jgi:hypothetical protein
MQNHAIGYAKHIHDQMIKAALNSLYSSMGALVKNPDPKIMKSVIKRMIIARGRNYGIDDPEPGMAPVNNEGPQDALRIYESLATSKTSNENANVVILSDNMGISEELAYSLMHVPGSRVDDKHSYTTTGYVAAKANAEILADISMALASNRELINSSVSKALWKHTDMVNSVCSISENLDRASKRVALSNDRDSEALIVDLRRRLDAYHADVLKCLENQSREATSELYKLVYADAGERGTVEVVKRGGVTKYVVPVLNTALNYSHNRNPVNGNVTFYLKPFIAKPNASINASRFNGPINDRFAHRLDMLLTNFVITSLARLREYFNRMSKDDYIVDSLRINLQSSIEFVNSYLENPTIYNANEQLEDLCAIILSPLGQRTIMHGRFADEPKNYLKLVADRNLNKYGSETHPAFEGYQDHLLIDPLTLSAAYAYFNEDGSVYDNYIRPRDVRAIEGGAVSYVRASDTAQKPDRIDLDHEAYRHIVEKPAPSKCDGVAALCCDHCSINGNNHLVFDGSTDERSLIDLRTCCDHCRLMAAHRYAETVSTTYSTIETAEAYRTEVKVTKAKAHVIKYADATKSNAVDPRVVFAKKQIADLYALIKQEVLNNPASEWAKVLKGHNRYEKQQSEFILSSGYLPAVRLSLEPTIPRDPEDNDSELIPDFPTAYNYAGGRKKSQYDLDMLYCINKWPM